MSVLGFELSWRAASSELRAAIATLAAELMAGRARRTAAQHREGFAARTELIVCNLIALHLARTDAWLAAPRGHDAAAFSSVYGKQFTAVLDALLDRGFIEQTEWYVAERKRVPASVRARPELLLRLPQPLTLRDLRLEAGAALELRSSKDDEGKRDVLPFEPTPDALRMAADVRRINAALADADVTVDGMREFAFLTHAQAIAKLITWHHKGTLRRIFTNGSFDSFGRLENGFWLSMPKRERCRLRLDGEPAVAVDYRAMIPRLAYAQAGKLLDPADDPYDVKGLPREGVKRVLLAMICARKELKRFPEGTAQFFSGMPARAVLQAIETRHYGIRDSFYKGIGDALFRTESDLCVENMLAMVSRRVAALPVYDCLLVPQSRAMQAQEQMLSAGMGRGLWLPVSVSEPYLSQVEL